MPKVVAYRELKNQSQYSDRTALQFLVFFFFWSPNDGLNNYQLPVILFRSKSGSSRQKQRDLSLLRKLLTTPTALAASYSVGSGGSFPGS